MKSFVIAPLCLVAATIAPQPARCEDPRVVFDLASVGRVCSDAVVVTHESNDVLFEIVDHFHGELLDQFLRLARQVTDVRFGYSGRASERERPFGLEYGYSSDKAGHLCDAHLEMNAGIAFLAADRFAITSYISVRRNERPTEKSMPNSERGVLSLWRYVIRTDPFQGESVRSEAHKQAIEIADSFSRARKGKAN